MPRPSNTEKKIDKALELFERLVVALELRNYLDQIEKLQPTATGWTCPRCGTYVTQGTYHSCFAMGGGTYVQCGETSHLGTCTLPKDHTSVHQFYRVMNVATDG